MSGFSSSGPVVFTERFV